MTQPCPSSLLRENLQAYVGRGLYHPITGVHKPILFDVKIYAYYMVSYPILPSVYWRERTDGWVFLFFVFDGVENHFPCFLDLNLVHRCDIWTYICICICIFDVCSARHRVQCPINMCYMKHVRPIHPAGTRL